MPVTAVWESDIKTMVCNQLGCGAIGVELTADQMSACMEEAKDWFLRYISKAAMKTATLTLTANTVYDVEDDCEMVTEVIFEGDGASLMEPDLWAGVRTSLPHAGYESATDGGVYSNVLQELQYRETGMRIIGSDTSWIWDPANRKLVISPLPASGNNVQYTYTSNEWDYGKLARRDIGLLRRRVKAEAMEILGHIRSKFSELPSGDGSVSLNGDTLLANADTLREKLDQEIELVQAPLMPMFG